MSSRRSPDAVERLVDNLLARPAHGERWARHWLDLVRYADSNGYERDAAKPFAWRYRDYVIRAFNADKPFDRFVLEQIAGDELPEGEIQPETPGRHRLLPARPLGRRAGRPETRPLRPARRPGQHNVRGLPGSDPRLCPVPQPQVRAADHARLLPHGRDLRAAPAAGRGRTERTLPIGTPKEIAAAEARGNRLRAGLLSQRAVLETAGQSLIAPRPGGQSRAPRSGPGFRR